MLQRSLYSPSPAPRSKRRGASYIQIRTVAWAVESASQDRIGIQDREAGAIVRSISARMSHGMRRRPCALDIQRLSCIFCTQWAMHLTPVHPRCSGLRRGGLYADPRRIRTALRHRRCVPCLSGSAAVADRVLLPPVHNQRQLDNYTTPHDVPPVWIPSLGHGRDDLPSNPPSFAGLVPSHVVDDRSEA